MSSGSYEDVNETVRQLFNLAKSSPDIGCKLPWKIHKLSCLMYNYFSLLDLSLRGDGVWSDIRVL